MEYDNIFNIWGFNYTVNIVIQFSFWWIGENIGCLDIFLEE